MDFVVPYDQLGQVSPGPWQNAAPQAGQPGSIVNALVFPAVQNEILNVQDEALLTRDSTNNAQLLQAIRSGKLTFFADSGTADALVITPRTSFLNFAAGFEVTIWKNPNVGANATATPKLSSGALSMTLVKADGSTLAVGDLPAGAFFTARSDGTSLRVQGARRSDYQASSAATNGGLVDNGGAFGLNLDNLPVETGINGADKLAFQTEESEDGLAGGVPFAASAASLAAYVLANIKSTNTFPLLLSNPVVYVRSDGNDANNGSANTPASAFATNAGAVAYVNNNFLTNAKTVTIVLGIPGTYAPPPVVNAGTFLIVSNPSDPGAYIIAGTPPAGSGAVTSVTNGASLSYNGVALQNTGSGFTFEALYGGSVTLTNTALTGTSTATYYAVAGSGGSINVSIGTSFAGNAAGYLYAIGGGNISLAPTVFAVIGTPTLTKGFAVAQDCGTIGVVSGASFSGSANGPRFYVDTNAVINSSGGGPAFFPGSQTGVQATQGLYVN